MSIKRREFLTSAAAGTAALVAGRRAAAADADPATLVPLGKHLKVSRIGFGTGMRGWLRQSNQTKLGEEGFAKLILHAYDNGIRLFDCADLYGSHPFIGKALKDKPRDSYAVISKIWWRPKGLQEDERPDADVVVARFLKELQSDYVDLVHLHCVMSANWPTELRKQMDILEDLKQKGKIKAHGVSCHSLEALSAAAEEPWVDAVNTRINPYGVKMDGPADKVVPVLKKLHEAGKGVVGMKIIGEGEFRNDEAKREESVKFAIGLGCVDAMVVGFENTGEMDEFKKRVAKALNEKK